MEYRIRYCDPAGSRQAEVVVEAASPTEALVKFCHTCDKREDPVRLRERVTSISTENRGEELH